VRPAASIAATRSSIAGEQSCRSSKRRWFADQHPSAADASLRSRPAAQTHRRRETRRCRPTTRDRGSPGRSWRVRAMLHRAAEREDGRRGGAVQRDDLRPTSGVPRVRRARLVERDAAHLARIFEVHAALDQDAFARGSRPAPRRSPPDVEITSAHGQENHQQHERAIEPRVPVGFGTSAADHGNGRRQHEDRRRVIHARSARPASAPARAAPGRARPDG